MMIKTIAVPAPAAKAVRKRGNLTREAAQDHAGRMSRLAPRHAPRLRDKLMSATTA